MDSIKLGVIVSLTISGTPLLTLNSVAAKSQRPNIIFLLTDDQRFDALGCMGNDQIKTPNIDKLAERGIVFDNHYNTTAISMASRAQIMTGMYEFKTGCNFEHGPMSTEIFQRSYPVLLREAGYTTGFAGKFGFAVIGDGFGSSNYNTDDLLPSHEFDWWRGWPRQGFYKTDENPIMKEYAAEYPHVSEALGAAGADFIRQYASSSKPFCLSVSFKAPHSPVSPNIIYKDMYNGVEFDKSENYGEKGLATLPEHAKMDRQFKRLFDRWKGEEYDNAISQYYQLIYGVDVAIGMIMEELEKQGVADNTIIIYTTDNGYFCGSHSLGGKILLYEEGSRGPLIISGPESYVKNRGRRSTALSGNIDMAPTILSLAEVDIPKNMDGESLLPVMMDKKNSIKDHQLLIQTWGEKPIQSLALRMGDYKYIYWFYGGDGMTPLEELYDMRNDRIELKNIINDKRYAKVVKTIKSTYREYLNKWREESVQGNNYPQYSTLFDPDIEWSKKEPLLVNMKKK